MPFGCPGSDTQSGVKRVIVSARHNCSFSVAQENLFGCINQAIKTRVDVPGVAGDLLPCLTHMAHGNLNEICFKLSLNILSLLLKLARARRNLKHDLTLMTFAVLQLEQPLF